LWRKIELVPLHDSTVKQSRIKQNFANHFTVGFYGISSNFRQKKDLLAGASFFF
jgi:hypothetical protein